MDLPHFSSNHFHYYANDSILNVDSQDNHPWLDPLLDYLDDSSYEPDCLIPNHPPLSSSSSSTTTTTTTTTPPPPPPPPSSRSLAQQLTQLCLCSYYCLWKPSPHSPHRMIFAGGDVNASIQDSTNYTKVKLVLQAYSEQQRIPSAETGLARVAMQSRKPQFSTVEAIIGPARQILKDASIQALLWIPVSGSGEVMELGTTHVDALLQVPKLLGGGGHWPMMDAGMMLEEEEEIVHKSRGSWAPSAKMDDLRITAGESTAAKHMGSAIAVKPVSHLDDGGEYGGQRWGAGAGFTPCVGRGRWPAAPVEHLISRSSPAGGASAFKAWIKPGRGGGRSRSVKRSASLLATCLLAWLPKLRSLDPLPPPSSLLLVQQSTPPSFTDTPHVISERKRRLRQKEHFAALKALVPSITKRDKVTILQQSVGYIKRLKERIEELERRQQQQRPAECESGRVRKRAGRCPDIIARCAIAPDDSGDATWRLSASVRVDERDANDVLVDLVSALNNKGLDCIRLESTVATSTACLHIDISTKPKGAGAGRTDPDNTLADIEDWWHRLTLAIETT